MNQQRQAITCGLIAVLMWSTVATAFKITLETLSPVELVFYSSLTATLIYFIVLLAQHQVRSLTSLTKSDWMTFALLGLINPCLYYFLLFQAYDLLTAQEALCLNYSWPIHLTVLSILWLKRPCSRWQWIGLFLGYCGLIVIVIKGNVQALEYNNIGGVLYGLASAFTWACYWILMIKQSGNRTRLLFCSFLCSLPFTCLFLMLSGSFHPLSWKSSLGVTYVGLFEMGIPFILWGAALSRATSTALISNLAFLSPVISVILINLILKESIQPSTIIGGSLILVGVILSQKTKAEPSQLSTDGSANIT